MVIWRSSVVRRTTLNVGIVYQKSLFVQDAGGAGRWGVLGGCYWVWCGEKGDGNGFILYTTYYMLSIYIREGCPFVERVRAAAAPLQLAIDWRDIVDPQHCADLMARGGKCQVPFLVDDEYDACLYESEDIIAYLEGQYGAGA